LTAKLASRSLHALSIKTFAARRQINDAYVIRSLAVFVPPQSKLPSRCTRDLAAPYGEI